MSNRKHTTIYLEQEQDAALKELATKQVSYSEHIRRAIDEYLARMNGETAAPQ
jgi:predicted transcriptional regulator